MLSIKQIFYAEVGSTFQSDQHFFLSKRTTKWKSLYDDNIIHILLKSKIVTNQNNTNLKCIT